MSPTPTTPASQSSIRDRLRRLTPYFGSQRGIWAVAVLATLMAALTEPLIPALFQPLLDKGFAENKLPLWSIPAAVVGLFTVRGVANFVAQYALSRLTNDGMEKLRFQLFSRLMKADLSLFFKQSASALSNTIVYEVQNGAAQLVSAVIALARDGFTLIALLGYLMWLNWKLTLVVFTVAPGLSWIMKALSRRLYKLTKESQAATDNLAYVVEENVLAHRVVRLQGGQAHQVARFGQLAQVLRRLALKTTVASAAMTPLTQIMAALSLSMVLVIALYQSQNGASGATVGGFVAFITAMLMLIAPIKRLTEISNPITRGLAALERGLNLIDDAKEETQGTYTTPRAKGSVTWTDVHLQFTADSQPQGSNFMGNKTGQNTPADSVKLASLPYDPFTSYLLKDEPIRVNATKALPTSGGQGESIQRTEKTYALMTHMSASLGVNCTFCHNTQNFGKWDGAPPQRVTAYHGIRMVQALNNEHMVPLTDTFPANRKGELGDVAKLNCATCHQGAYKPVFGAPMLKDSPGLASLRTAFEKMATAPTDGPAAAPAAAAPATQ